MTGLGGWLGSWLGGGGGGTVVAPGPLNAAEIIGLARKQHPAFSESAIPAPVAYALLTTLYAELQQEGLALDPNVSATELAHTPLNPWDPTIPVPANTAIIGGLVYFDAGSPQVSATLDFVAYADRLRVDHRYAAYEENEQLVLVGTEDNWRGVDYLIVRYLAAPEVLNDATDSLYLPLSARPAVVSGLALAFGERCEGLGIAGVNTKALGAKHQHAHDAWLQTMGRAGRPRLLQIEDVT